MSISQRVSICGCAKHVNTPSPQPFCSCRSASTSPCGLLYLSLQIQVCVSAGCSLLSAYPGQPPTPPAGLCCCSALAGLGSAGGNRCWEDGFAFSHFGDFFPRVLASFSSHVPGWSSGVGEGREPDLGHWGKKKEAKAMMSGQKAWIPGGTGAWPWVPCPKGQDFIASDPHGEVEFQSFLKHPHTMLRRHRQSMVGLRPLHGLKWSAHL